MLPRTLLLMTLVLSTNAVLASNQSPIIMIEDAQEASTGNVTLPSSNAGTLHFTHCDACNRNPLKLDATSRFFLSDIETPFDSFKKAYNMSSNLLLTVYFKPDTHIVTRIRLNPVTPAGSGK